MYPLLALWARQRSPSVGVNIDQGSFEKSKAPERGWAASCARVAVEGCREEEIQLEETQLELQQEELPD